ncbi:MAG: sigma 54-interacting transcriptional regulator [Lentisphaeraceae bacterium]|nr:sigma 54-interacting transcriptional regulator [Lentisphaeraceae bacterium]
MQMLSISRIFKSFKNAQSINCVLDSITSGLAEESGNALVRIWLIDKSDDGQKSSFSNSDERQQYLQLASSHGTSLSGESWQNIKGHFSRLPLGHRKIGHIGQGHEVLLPDLESDNEWIANPQWARDENICSFAGQPLTFKGQVIGVLAVFSRSPLNEEDMGILRAFAAQAAASIANAQAFEEISLLKKKLEEENEYLRQEVVQISQFKDIIGNSLPLQKVLEQIELVAPADSTVLINGESGTGKELIARAIHEKSKRQGKAMIKVNCASIPRELFESEFFGHVKGAFTGALRDRIGRFQLADGGTLFLDEVGEIPIDLQSKLLRVLQEGQFERVGDEKTIKTNVRIITATNRDLKAAISDGSFRQDLYYRLSVFPIEMPALKERLDDIPLLADFFLTQFSQRYGIRKPILKKKHLTQLQSYDWPGNIRELQNFVERALITSQRYGLNFELNSTEVTIAPTISDANEDILTEPEVRAFERANIIRALEECQWKVGGQRGAAAMLDMKPTTLASRIKAMNIVRC